MRIVGMPGDESMFSPAVDSCFVDAEASSRLLLLSAFRGREVGHSESAAPYVWTR